LWAFSVRDLAQLYGTTVEAARKLIQRGRIDPTDLATVVAYWDTHRGPRGL
jgi:hypothetical protein